MKIDVLRIIEDALIGGRDGEMAFIENNPLVAQLYRESGKTFRDFLKAIVEGEETTKVRVDNNPVKKFILYKSSIKNIVSGEEFNDFEEVRKIYEDARAKVNGKAGALSNILRKHPFFNEMVGYPHSNTISYNCSDNTFYGYIDTRRLLEIK